MPSKRRATASDSNDDDEYRKKRERNNLAVKKCRIKSTEKAKETRNKINKLKADNERLEGTIEELQKNVKFLKEIILEKNPLPEQKLEIQKIIAEIDDD